MALRIVCPSCGATKGLKGAPSPEGIRVSCGACGGSWLRDEASRSCVTCGATDLVTRPNALTQYSRGSQLSIVGTGEILLCRRCDAKMVEWSDGTRAVPFSYRSAALDPDAVAEREEDEGDDVRITP